MAGTAAALAAGVVLNCWAAAAYRYQLPVDLLYAIGQVESDHRTSAVGHNPDGSRDLGVMQINTQWLPVLANYGITEHDLLTDPCKNIQVGAWILAQEVARTGYTWYSIGAYNAGPITAKTSPEARKRKIATYRTYAGKVLARWKAIANRRKASGATPAPDPTPTPRAQPSTATSGPESANSPRHASGAG